MTNQPTLEMISSLVIGIQRGVRQQNEDQVQNAFAKILEIAIIAFPSRIQELDLMTFQLIQTVSDYCSEVQKFFTEPTGIQSSQALADAEIAIYKFFKLPPYYVEVKEEPKEEISSGPFLIFAEFDQSDSYSEPFGWGAFDNMGMIQQESLEDRYKKAEDNNMIDDLHLELWNALQEALNK